MERMEGLDQPRRTWAIFQARLWASFMLAFIPCEGGQGRNVGMGWVTLAGFGRVGVAWGEEGQEKSRWRYGEYVHASPAINTRSLRWKLAATR